MPHSEHLCGHENVIDDEREGSCVCINCGLVLESQLFLPGFNEIKYEKKITDIKEIEKNEQIRELLHRINLPDFLSAQISRKCEGKSKKKIPFYMYQTLNENGCPISMKEVSAVSGFTNSDIYKHQENNNVIILKPELMLEKYCKILDLNFSAYSVIKEKMLSVSMSGHSPLTIIGSNIYLYTKNNNLKIPMKKIAKTINISCISIQRYLKKLRE